MQNNEVEQIEVPLGGQPVHRQPPTQSQVQAQAQTNAATVNDLWKALRDKINEVGAQVPQGNDTPTMELRNWVSFNRGFVGDKIKD